MTHIRPRGIEFVDLTIATDECLWPWHGATWRSQES